jgi:hypothetical protein
VSLGEYWVRTFSISIWFSNSPHPGLVCFRLARFASQSRIFVWHAPTNTETLGRTRFSWRSFQGKAEFYRGRNVGQKRQKGLIRASGGRSTHYAWRQVFQIRTQRLTCLRWRYRHLDGARTRTGTSTDTSMVQTNTKHMLTIGPGPKCYGNCTSTREVPV